MMGLEYVKNNNEVIGIDPAKILQKLQVPKV